jgi:hypothetical protein
VLIVLAIYNTHSRYRARLVGWACPFLSGPS